MSLNDLVDLAAAFWSRAGDPPAIPRDLEQVIVITEKIPVIRLRRLSPTKAARWLKKRHQEFPLGSDHRPLNGLIVAYRGAVMIFLERDLSPADRRVILAHEFGHYLADYDAPRRRVAARLGTAVLAVLDGDRPATTGEDLAAVLAGVPLALHVHYLERGFDPNHLSAIDRVERRANELACELLAPRRIVLPRIAASHRPRQREVWSGLLQEEFGLPLRWAWAYAGFLLDSTSRHLTFSEQLGL